MNVSANTPNQTNNDIVDEPLRIEHPFREFLRMYVRNYSAVAGFLIFVIILS